jgi:hypothetical protein
MSTLGAPAGGRTLGGHHGVDSERCRRITPGKSSGRRIQE